MEYYLKRPNEIKTLTADFSPAIMTGESVNTGEEAVQVYELPAGVTVTSNLLITDSVSASTSVISCRVQAGEGNKKYKVTFNTGITDLNNLYELDVYVTVADNNQILGSLPEIKNALSLVDSTYDSLLYELIRSASSWVEGETRRTFYMKNCVEDFYLERAQKEIVLHDFPVQSIISITTDGVTLEPTVGGYNTYSFESFGTVKRLDSGAFPGGQFKTTVSYVAGYDVIPYEIHSTVKKVVINEFNFRTREGVIGESMGDYNIKYGINSVMGSDLIRTVIERYRRRNI